MKSQCIFPSRPKEIPSDIFLEDLEECKDMLEFSGSSLGFFFFSFIKNK